MMIHENAWAVGSLASSDQNGQSFKPSQRRRGRNPARSLLDHALEQGDSVYIEPQATHRYESETATMALGNAISLSQTQDAFLQNVQKAMIRMTELSNLVAQDDNAGARQAALAEFSQLQNSIKDIGARMYKATNLFQSTDLRLAWSAGGIDTATSATATEGSVHDLIESTSDPRATAIHDPASASLAAANIGCALKAVADARLQVGNNLQSLCLTGESLSASGDASFGGRVRIKDIGVAEASTQFVRSDMLTKSGTAMLAQANALPESAFRLLD